MAAHAVSTAHIKQILFMILLLSAKFAR